MLSELSEIQPGQRVRCR